MTNIIEILKQAIYSACYSYGEQPTFLEKFEDFTEITLVDDPSKVEHPHLLARSGTVGIAGLFGPTPIPLPKINERPYQTEVVKLKYYISLKRNIINFNICSCGTIFVYIVKDH